MTEQEWLACNDPQRMLEWVTKSSLPRLANVPPSARKLRLLRVAWCRAAWDDITEPRSRHAVEVGELFADKLVDDFARQDACYALPRIGDPLFLTGPHLAIHACMPDGFRQELPLSELLGNSSRLCPECHGAGAINLGLADAQCGTCHGVGRFVSLGRGILPYAGQSDVLRDIIGNPFRPVTLPSRDRWGPLWWIAESVAEAAYDERLADGTLDLVRLSILADALEEAGCDSEDILRHLRSQDKVKCDNFYYDKQRPCTNGMLYTGMDGMKWIPCNKCNQTGFLPILAVHYRGCWAIDLLLGKD